MTSALPTATACPAHGGPHGESDARWPVRIDCSTSVNAYGPAESVVDALRTCLTPQRIACYPDPLC